MITGEKSAGLLTVLSLCASVVTTEMQAQSYPAKPIHLLVGFTPGGGADAAARTIGPKLADYLGQSVVIENRPGASGSIAIERTVKSPADGYTLVLMGASSVINAVLQPKLPYNLQRDLAPISIVTSGTFVFVIHPSVPARNVKELIALAKAQSGKLNYGSNGVGSSGHFAGALFGLMSGVNIVHVPFKGSSDSVIAAVAGQIEMGFPGIPTVQPFMSNGRLRVLAVTSSKRSTLLPDVPTLDEAGLRGYEYSSWQGVLAPAAVPKDIVARLNAAIVKAGTMPEIKDAFSKQGNDVRTTTPEQFATFISGEMEQNAKLIKATGVKPE